LQHKAVWPVAACLKHQPMRITTKERAVGDEQDEGLQEKRTAREQLFQTLPPAGSAAYWQRIEQAPAEGALSPEVLARCLRERLQNGTRQEAYRIFDVIWLRAQTSITSWAKKVASRSQGGRGLQIEEDLVAECYAALWKELETNERTFLLENFQHKLKLLECHVAHAVMEREGFWKRKGVENPNVIQRENITSIEADTSADNGPSLTGMISDPHSQALLEHLEELIDLETLLAKLDPPARQMLYDLWCGFTQEETAKRLGITDRTVRNRLEAIRKYLRQQLEGEEHQHG
jgi:RNA polymerase sigma factor (sigma-70 family)